MENRSLHQRLAYLESVNDHLTTEMAYLDDLLKSIGFPQGLLSVKRVAEEIIQEEKEGCES